jgi:hypothetical protein
MKKNELLNIQNNVSVWFPKLYIDQIPFKLYRQVEQREDGCMFISNNKLCVIISGEEHNGKKWIHLSLSRNSRVPDYKDITRIKKHFIGDHNKAVMVFPEDKYHVNMHPYCLHLYHCVGNEDGLPEFGRYGTI